MGDETSVEAILSAIYPQLRRIARGLLAGERRSHTLQPTALANEAVVRLLRRELSGDDPRTLVNSGIREMRTILIDWGRHCQRRKADLDERGRTEVKSHRIEDLLHLHQCLKRLASVDDRASQVVQLRILVGLTVPETAEYLGVSPRSISEDWEFARCWLAQQWRAND